MRLAFFPLAIVASSTALTAPARATADVRPGAGARVVEHSASASKPALGLISVAHELTLDPESGALDGITDVTLRPETESLTHVSLWMDSGLRVTSASAYDRAVTFEEHVDGASNWVRLRVTPPLSPRTLRTLHLTYSGRLKCWAADHEPRCKLGGGAGYLLEGSGMPAVFDGAIPLPGVLPSPVPSERILVLSRPTDVMAIASGELLEEHDVGGTRVSHFFTPESSLGTYALVLGKLRVLANAELEPPLRLWSLAGESQSQALGWLSGIVPFLDRKTGRTLPFTRLEVAELPAALGLSSAVGHGFVGLSDGAASETELALAGARLWWGTLVMPSDAERVSFMLAGLVRHTEIDYQSLRQPPAEREAYLARRMREQQLLIRYGTEGWFDAAAHEHLRVAVGEEAYARAVKRWVNECAGLSCTTDRFRELVEEESGIRLESFFSQWVYRQTPAKPEMSFEQTSERGIQVAFQALDGMELTLELVIELMDGERLTRRVQVSERTSVVEVDVPSLVRRVFPNPRHDGVVWSRSAQAGDVDLDGEVDGYDLAHCAYRVGQTAKAQPTNLDFDPRCDSNEDGRIDESDLADTVEHFARIRTETAW